MEVPVADEILKTRLAEVRRTLERASLTRLRREAAEAETYDDSEKNWITVGLSLPNVIKNSWEFLESQFKQDSEMIAYKIEALQEAVERPFKSGSEEERRAELVTLWEEYDKLERSSEKLLGEIVELMGGLAFRDRSVDPWFFATADELVGWYAQRTNEPWDGVTVPCVRGAVAWTLVRIVGFRFPEWSVWALPLTAYEFAYQYLKVGGLKPAKVKEMIKTYLEGEVEIEELGEYQVLLADAFATFTTGPAYLFAALGLRLSPQEAERALVIFRVLERLDDEERTYTTDFLRDFRTQWESSPASGERVDPARAHKLERFAEVAVKALEKSYLPATRYSAGDWIKAKDISKIWKVDGKIEGKPLQMPPTARLKLIDVLNAAWLSRFNAVDTDRLEKAARKLCSSIIKTQGSPGVSTPQQPAPYAQTGVGS
jgi:hypothetical protein